MAMAGGGGGGGWLDVTMDEQDAGYLRGSQSVVIKMPESRRRLCVEREGELR